MSDELKRLQAQADVSNVIEKFVAGGVKAQTAVDNAIAAHGGPRKLTEEEIRAATQVRIAQALAHVQQAQNELGRAADMLSALEYGSPAHTKAGNLYDAVHTFWYVVDALRHHRKVRLDPTNIAALEQRLSAQAVSS